MLNSHRMASVSFFFRYFRRVNANKFGIYDEFKLAGPGEMLKVFAINFQMIYFHTVLGYGVQSILRNAIESSAFCHWQDSRIVLTDNKILFHFFLFQRNFAQNTKFSPGFG